MNKPIALGTRGSLLAKTQSQWVADQLIKVQDDLSIELTIFKTAGDNLSISLTSPAVPGAFVNALRDALLAKEVDFIVHSLKDLPSGEHPEISLAAIPEREDHRDVLVSAGNVTIDKMLAGSVIGTSSPRRTSALRALNSELQARPVRGNVDSRIKKVRDGEYAGIILAAAGLKRIGREGEIAQYFNPEELIPAPAQGALAVECRKDDLEMQELLNKIDHAPTRLTSLAERAVLQGLNAGCDLAVGAFAKLDGLNLKLTAELGSPSNSPPQRFDSYTLLTSFQDFPAAENLGLDLARRFVR
jgi:hydroxymethylbilane synthase